MPPGAGANLNPKGWGRGEFGRFNVKMALGLQREHLRRKKRCWDCSGSDICASVGWCRNPRLWKKCLWLQPQALFHGLGFLHQSTDAQMSLPLQSQHHLFRRRCSRCSPRAIFTLKRPNSPLPSLLGLNWRLPQGAFFIFSH